MAYDNGMPYATDVVVIKDGVEYLLVTKRKEKLDNDKLNFDVEKLEKYDNGS